MASEQNKLCRVAAKLKCLSTEDPTRFLLLCSWKALSIHLVLKVFVQFVNGTRDWWTRFGHDLVQGTPSSKRLSLRGSGINTQGIVCATQDMLNKWCAPTLKRQRVIITAISVASLATHTEPPHPCPQCNVLTLNRAFSSWPQQTLRRRCFGVPGRPCSPCGCFVKESDIARRRSS